MKMKEVCTASGLTERAVRFYVQEGLAAPDAQRRGGGFGSGWRPMNGCASPTRPWRRAWRITPPGCGATWPVSPLSLIHI